MLQTSKLVVENVHPLYRELKRCQVDGKLFGMGGYWWRVYICSIQDEGMIERDYAYTFQLETDLSEDINLLDK